jgi:hypothetical protein
MSRAPITDCGCPYDDRLRQGHREECPTLVALAWPDGTPKIAPVQGYPGGIPWSIHLEAYEAYFRAYRGQAALIDLDRRGCRGGFGTGELDQFIPGWRERSGYGGKEITFKGAQMWVNHVYWKGQSWSNSYLNERLVPRNPVARQYGMSGECLCGAFAKPGELAMVRRVDPGVSARIERLQIEARARGHDWGWEDRPPRPPKMRDDQLTGDLFHPMCVHCLKSPEREAA